MAIAKEPFHIGKRRDAYCEQLLLMVWGDLDKLALWLKRAILLDKSENAFFGRLGLREDTEQARRSSQWLVRARGGTVHRMDESAVGSGSLFRGGGTQDAKPAVHHSEAIGARTECRNPSIVARVDYGPKSKEIPRHCHLL